MVPCRDCEVATCIRRFYSSSTCPNVDTSRHTHPLDRVPHLRRFPGAWRVQSWDSNGATQRQRSATGCVLNTLTMHIALHGSHHWPSRHLPSRGCSCSWAVHPATTSTSTSPSMTQLRAPCGALYVYSIYT
jgi:hypothetical protein